MWRVGRMQSRDRETLKLKTIFILLLMVCAAKAQVPPPPQAPPNGPAPVLRQPIVRQPTPSDFSGSVMIGQATADTLSLSLLDALRRGLQYNLGALVNRDTV